MKIPKIVVFDTKARRKLLKGVNILGKAVGSTLGPKGRNVAVNQAYGVPTIWHDGVSVAKSINLKDHLQDMGVEILKEAAIKTNDKAGDGTTTATVLGQSLINEGFKLIEAGINPMTIKKEIEDASVFCYKRLKELSKEISSDDEIEQIATISSADPKVGKLVAEAIKKVGKDGVITVEEGKSFETDIEYKQGLEFDRGYLSQYFITDQEKSVCEMTDPYILLTDKKINHIHELTPFVEKFLESGGKDLVIIAGEVVEDSLATLVLNKMRGVLNVVAIQAPSFGDKRIEELQDLSVITGGTVILNDSGRDLKSVSIEELGRTGKITVYRDKTTIVDGYGKKEDIEKRMSELREQIKTVDNEYYKKLKKERLARLVGGVAVINVGANTEVEIRDKKERIIDAINATKAAIEEGIVAGGEITLLQIAQEGFWKELSTTGSGILRRALLEPFKRLVSNAGYDYAEIKGKIEAVKYPKGIDVMDGKIKDLIKNGIIDPVKVTRSALENAISVAVMCMTTDTLITDDISEE